MSRHVRAEAVKQRSNFEIDCAENSYIPVGPHFDLCVGQLGAKRYQHVVAQPVHPAAEQSLTVLKKKYAMRHGTVPGGRRIHCVLAVDSHDAPRKQIWKRQGIISSDFGVEESAVACPWQRGYFLGPDRFDQQGKRRNSLLSVLSRTTPEPRHPFFGVGERGIDQDGSLTGQHQLQAWDVFEIDPENAKPVSETVPGNVTQCVDLKNAGSETFIAQGVIEIVRNEERLGPAKKIGRLPGNPMPG